MSKGLTLLSIITVSRNSLRELKRTNESLRRDLPPWVETILIDSASTDGTTEYARSPSSVYQHVVSEPDSGIFDGMNKGIRLASGKYLWFLNCDDLVHPDLDWQTLGSELAASNEVLVGDIRVENGGQVEVHPNRFTHVSLFHYTVPHQGSFIPAAYFQTFGEYDHSYRLKGDQEWFYRVFCSGGRFRPLGWPVAVYAGGGVSERPSSRPIQKTECRRYRMALVGPLRYVVYWTIAAWKRTWFGKTMNRVLRRAKRAWGARS